MKDPNTKLTDGFGNTESSKDQGFVVYTNSDGFRVHYLHGALHIFDRGDQIIKKTYNNTQVNLVEQITESLNNGIYPIFISEGSNTQKMTKIIHNAYLNHCYKSLKKIRGDLIILGTYLKKNDSHILNAIMESNVENIFIGVSNASSIHHIETAITDHNTHIKNMSAAKTKGTKKAKQLYLYDYKSANIWNSN